MMISIISATNRRNSNTLNVAREIERFISEIGPAPAFFNLEDLPGNLFVPEMYTDDKSEAFKKIEKEILIPSQKFVFVLPEYNGSYPGILKAMMDASDIKKCWYNKKALLIGVADGRAGNLRGMDHLTGVLNYMRVSVYHDKLPISKIESLMENGQFIDDDTLRTVKKLLHEFIQF